MKQSIVTIAVSGLLMALCFSCSMETGSIDEASVVGTQSAALTDDGTISPGCRGFLGECRDGNEKMCKKYSERCEVRIGVIGDSLSDEYQGFFNFPGLQWTEQVQQDLRISLGAFENYGEPRHDGYALNWGRFGQAALSVQWNHPVIYSIDPLPRVETLGPFQNLVDGLSGQIANDEVDVAVVWIGHNDLFIHDILKNVPGGYSLYLEGISNADEFYAALVTRIIGAALQLKAVAASDPEDIKAKVVIMGLAGEVGDPGLDALNNALAQAAAAYGIPFINPWHVAVGALAYEQATTGGVAVGDTTVAPFTAALAPRVAEEEALAMGGTGPCMWVDFYGTFIQVCATPDYAEPFLHFDGVHPNTLYAGMIGNQIITDLNDMFGFAMRTIPADQLLDNAGL